jgi:hypothetical protein
MSSALAREGGNVGKGLAMRKLIGLRQGNGVSSRFPRREGGGIFWNLHIYERDCTLARMIYEWIGDHTFSSV